MALLQDVEAIRMVAVHVAHRLDVQDWEGLQSLFDSEVTVDHGSLHPGGVVVRSSKELVDGWRGSLTSVDATQHLLGPIDVEVDVDVATAHCHVRGYHYAPGCPGGEQWMVAGHFRFALRRRAAGWRIHQMQLTAFYQTGNRALLAEAAARPLGQR